MISLQPISLLGYDIAHVGAILCGLGFISLLLYVFTKRRSPGFELVSPYIIDGDTIAKDKLRIRLWGIDAPEMDQTGGPEARAHLIRLIGRGGVFVSPVDTDKYGRMVAKLYVESGNVSELMVENGYALPYFTHELDGALKRAKRKKRGLWAKGGIRPPSRHRRRQN